MTTLTERYVAAVVGGLPAQQRHDVELELRASIADAIDARIGSGTDAVAAERDVLTEFGDPARLAATYAERPFYLIGPASFPIYRQLLIVLLAVIVPIVAIVVAIVEAASDASVGDVIGTVVWASVDTAVHIAFWTTLVFAVIDWSGAMKTRALPTWSLDSLPVLDVRRLSPPEAVMGVVTMVWFAGFIVWQHVFTVIRDDAGDRLPILSPDLWSFWLPFLLVLAAVEIVFTVVTFRQGIWNQASAIVNLALSVVFAIPVVVLTARGDLLNPALFDHLGWRDGAEGDSVLSVIIILSVIGIAIWDSVDGFRRAHRPIPAVSPLVLV